MNRLTLRRGACRSWGALALRPGLLIHLLGQALEMLGGSGATSRACMETAGWIHRLHSLAGRDACACCWKAPWCSEVGKGGCDGRRVCRKSEVVYIRCCEGGYRKCVDALWPKPRSRLSECSYGIERARECQFREWREGDCEARCRGWRK